MLVFLNPFSIVEYLLACNPFILTSAIALAFVEILFRKGHLPKNIAYIPYALILMLLATSSIQGFLLSISLVVTLLLRYILQSSQINFRQILGLGIIIFLPMLVLLIWHSNLLNTLCDFEKVSFSKFLKTYHVMYLLAKQHISSMIYLVVLLFAGLYKLFKIKSHRDIITDKYLLRTVFGIIFIYVGIILPVYFSYYEYSVRAGYSLGFVFISVLQFIVLMPLGRVVNEGLSVLKIRVPQILKVVILTSLLITFIMQKHMFYCKQDFRIVNMLEIRDFITSELPVNSKIALLDINKMVKFYAYILEYKNFNTEIIPCSIEDQGEGIILLHERLQKDKIDYVVLHAPNNLYVKSLEYNFNPNFSYIYKIEPKGFRLIEKFENKFYVDTNL